MNKIKIWFCLISLLAFAVSAVDVNLECVAEGESLIDCKVILIDNVQPVGFLQGVVSSAYLNVGLAHLMVIIGENFRK